MMLSLFRLEHLGQDHVFIYLIKIPLPALTKGTYLVKVFASICIFFLTHPPFPLNSKDYLCWFAVEVGWMGGGGATVSVGSIGLSEYWLVCCPPWLQARYDRSVPSGSQTGLFYLYRPAFFSLFIIHREVCESIITASLWLSQPCYDTICIADPLKTTTSECCRYNAPTLAETLGKNHLQDTRKGVRTDGC